MFKKALLIFVTLFYDKNSHVFRSRHSSALNICVKAARHLDIEVYKPECLEVNMDFIKAEMDKEFSSIGFKNQRRNLRQLDQVGKTDKIEDAKRKALLPGKRISKTGKVYWESRKNRSDAKVSKI